MSCMKPPFKLGKSEKCLLLTVSVRQMRVCTWRSFVTCNRLCIWSCDPPQGPGHAYPRLRAWSSRRGQVVGMTRKINIWGNGGSSRLSWSRYPPLSSLPSLRKGLRVPMLCWVLLPLLHSLCLLTLPAPPTPSLLEKQKLPCSCRLFSEECLIALPDWVSLAGGWHWLYSISIRLPSWENVPFIPPF